MTNFEQSLIIRKEFFLKACRNDFLSEKEGKPKYDNKPYISFIRGDGTAWARPAYPVDQQRYPDEWKAYLNNQKAIDSGTPITELFGLIPSEKATLEELGIVTVEGLAQCGLSGMEDLGERFVSLRSYAQTFLKQRSDMEQVFTLQQKVEALELENLRLQGIPQVMAQTVKAPIVKAVDPIEQETADDPFFGKLETKKGAKRPNVEIRA